jgi:hypothetical protein
MKLKIISIAVLTMIIVAIPLVHGDVDWTLPPNNLSSGYRVTTENFPDPVIIGDPVIAWAGTLNPDIDEVKFRWNYPDGSGQDPIIAVGAYAGYVDVPDVGRVYQWTDTQYPDVAGDWGIQAVFYDHDNPGEGIGPIPEQPFFTEIRARSFFSIPEVAIGTIAVIVAMFAALGLFAMKRKRVSIKTRL